MTLIIRGTRPRPRVGLVGIFLDEENDHFDRLFPTIWRAPIFGELEEKVQVNGLDLIIIGRENPHTRFSSDYCDLVHVICFSQDMAILPGPTDLTSINITGKSKNEEYDLPPLSLPFNRRREADLSEITNIRNWSQLGIFHSAISTDELERAEEKIRESAIIIDHNGNTPLAVIFNRENSGLGVAWLPNPVFDQGKWVELIASDWAQSDRESFPDFGDWTKLPQWMVPEEEDLVNKIDQLEANKREAIIEFDLNIASLHSDLSSATLAANKGLRRLITAQGEILVDEVANVFQEFGFEVDNMDEILDPKLPKREDLRLRDPSDNSNWEAIVEVRGYSRRTGTTADILRIARFVSFYQREKKGRLPDKRIYVVNGQIELSPDQRQDVLASSEEDIRVFSEDGGLIISTLDLFRAMKALNQLGKDKIKGSIKNAVGRWNLESIGD